MAPSSSGAAAVSGVPRATSTTDGFCCPAIRLVGAIAVASMLLTSCARPVAGHALKAAPRPDSSGVDVALLNPGNYPTRAGSPLGKVANEQAGRIVEAQRMANNVIGPWEVDTNLIDPIRQSTVLPDAESLKGVVVGENGAKIAAAHHFLLGFTSERQSGPHLPGIADEKAKGLSNAVLRFTNPEDAAAAASELAADNLTLPREDAVGAAKRFSIPDHPDTLANEADIASKKSFDIEAFTPHGPYVFFQYAGSKEGADATAALVAKAVDLQVPLIDRFQETPADQLANLPADPTGLLARTIPSTSDTVNARAVYEPHAALHFRPNPVASQKMFTTAGVEHVVVNRPVVYEAVDITGATRAVDDLVRLDMPYFGYKPSSGIRGLPSARCFDRGQTPNQNASIRFVCVAAADRYAIKARAAQLLDAQQIVTAQYLMVKAS